MKEGVRRKLQVTQVAGCGEAKNQVWVRLMQSQLFRSLFFTQTSHGFVLLKYVAVRLQHITSNVFEVRRNVPLWGGKSKKRDSCPYC